jgi:hypothetical protein
VFVLRGFRESYINNLLIGAQRRWVKESPDPIPELAKEF